MFILLPADEVTRLKEGSPLHAMDDAMAGALKDIVAKGGFDGKQVIASLSHPCSLGCMFNKS